MDEARLVVALESCVGQGNVLAGSAVRRAYDCDAYTVDKSPPTCVVLPSTRAAVQRVVHWCLENSVPFTPRGAGTGLSGGALPALGGVVVSTKKLNRILEVDIPNRCLWAESGVVNAHVTRAVAEHGMMFAPDPSSQTVSTIGGNINENSGGPHTLKHGVTADHVLQVTLVDPAGEIRTVGNRVTDGPGSEMLSLVVGSEGTVGIVTDAWLRLVPIPKGVETALVAFSTPRQATEAVAEIIACGVLPSALEMMDRNILVALKSAFGLDYPSGTGALLLIECDGSVDAALADMTRATEVCRSHGAIDVQIAQTSEERAKLWTARKKGIGAMGRLAPTIVTHDGVIPRSQLPEMLDFIYALADEEGLGVANLFHAGDGNLHPCFYFDDRVPGMVEKVVAAGERILRRCLELGGSVTGEHGIGVEKSAIWASGLDPQDLNLQHAVRDVFQTHDLCNPCKVIPDQKGCVEHMRRWRGAAT